MLTLRPPLRRVYLALGSNLGDRRSHLQGAVSGLRRRGARPLACSPVYCTAPVGGPAQEEFLNAVLEAETGLPPHRLLAAALQVEEEHGRQRGNGERWGPRTLDIDLLLYDDEVVEGVGLRVPHPRLHLRRFVLVPLHDLCPDRVHPVAGRTVRGLLAECPDASAVVRYGEPLKV